MSRQKRGIMHSLVEDGNGLAAGYKRVNGRAMMTGLTLTLLLVLAVAAAGRGLILIFPAESQITPLLGFLQFLLSAARHK